MVCSHSVVRNVLERLFGSEDDHWRLWIYCVLDCVMDLGCGWGMEKGSRRKRGLGYAIWGFLSFFRKEVHAWKNGDGEGKETFGRSIWDVI